jgi:dihydroxyacetone kinase
MELGLGIHGEPGARTASLQPVDGIVMEARCDVVP